MSKNVMIKMALGKSGKLSGTKQMYTFIITCFANWLEDNVEEEEKLQYNLICWVQSWYRVFVVTRLMRCTHFNSHFHAVPTI